MFLIVKVGISRLSNRETHLSRCDEYPVPRLFEYISQFVEMESLSHGKSVLRIAPPAS